MGLWSYLTGGGGNDGEKKKKSIVADASNVLGDSQKRNSEVLLAEAQKAKQEEEKLIEQEAEEARQKEVEELRHKEAEKKKKEKKKKKDDGGDAASGNEENFWEVGWAKEHLDNAKHISVEEQNQWVKDYLKYKYSYPIADEIREHLREFRLQRGILQGKNPTGLHPYKCISLMSDATAASVISSSSVCDTTSLLGGVKTTEDSTTPSKAGSVFPHLVCLVNNRFVAETWRQNVVIYTMNINRKRIYNLNSIPTAIAPMNDDHHFVVGTCDGFLHLFYENVWKQTIFLGYTHNIQFINCGRNDMGDIDHASPVGTREDATPSARWVVVVSSSLYTIGEHHEDSSVELLAASAKQRTVHLCKFSEAEGLVQRAETMVEIPFESLEMAKKSTTDRKPLELFTVCVSRHHIVLAGRYFISILQIVNPTTVVRRNGGAPSGGSTPKAGKDGGDIKKENSSSSETKTDQTKPLSQDEKEGSHKTADKLKIKEGSHKAGEGTPILKITPDDASEEPDDFIAGTHNTDDDNLGRRLLKKENHNASQTPSSPTTSPVSKGLSHEVDDSWKEGNHNVDDSWMEGTYNAEEAPKEKSGEKREKPNASKGKENSSSSKDKDKSSSSKAKSRSKTEKSKTKSSDDESNTSKNSNRDKKISKGLIILRKVKIPKLDSETLEQNRCIALSSVCLADSVFPTKRTDNILLSLQTGNFLELRLTKDHGTFGVWVPRSWIPSGKKRKGRKEKDSSDEDRSKFGMIRPAIFALDLIPGLGFVTTDTAGCLVVWDSIKKQPKCSVLEFGEGKNATYANSVLRIHPVNVDENANSSSSKRDNSNDLKASNDSFGGGGNQVCLVSNETLEQSNALSGCFDFPLSNLWIRFEMNQTWRTRVKQVLLHAFRTGMLQKAVEQHRKEKLKQRARKTKETKKITGSTRDDSQNSDAASNCSGEFTPKSILKTDSDGVYQAPVLKSNVQWGGSLGVQKMTSGGPPTEEKELTDSQKKFHGILSKSDEAHDPNDHDYDLFGVTPAQKKAPKERSIAIKKPATTGQKQLTICALYNRDNIIVMQVTGSKHDTLPICVDREEKGWGKKKSKDKKSRKSIKDDDSGIPYIPSCSWHTLQVANYSDLGNYLKAFAAFPDQLFADHLILPVEKSLLLHHADNVSELPMPNLTESVKTVAVCPFSHHLALVTTDHILQVFSQKGRRICDIFLGDLTDEYEEDAASDDEEAIVEGNPEDRFKIQHKTIPDAFYETNVILKYCNQGEGSNPYGANSGNYDVTKYTHNSSVLVVAFGSQVRVLSVSRGYEVLEQFSLQKHLVGAGNNSSMEVFTAANQNIDKGDNDKTIFKNNATPSTSTANSFRELRRFYYIHGVDLTAQKADDIRVEYTEIPALAVRGVAYFLERESAKNARHNPTLKNLRMSAGKKTSDKAIVEQLRKEHKSAEKIFNSIKKLGDPGTHLRNLTYISGSTYGKNFRNIDANTNTSTELGFGKIGIGKSSSKMMSTKISTARHIKNTDANMFASQRAKNAALQRSLHWATGWQSLSCIKAIPDLVFSAETLPIAEVNRRDAKRWDAKKRKNSYTSHDYTSHDKHMQLFEHQGIEEDDPFVDFSENFARPIGPCAAVYIVAKKLVVVAYQEIFDGRHYRHSHSGFDIAAGPLNSVLVISFVDALTDDILQRYRQNLYSPLRSLQVLPQSVITLTDNGELILWHR